MTETYGKIFVALLAFYSYIVLNCALGDQKKIEINQHESRLAMRKNCRDLYRDQCTHSLILIYRSKANYCYGQYNGSFFVVVP